MIHTVLHVMGLSTVMIIKAANDAGNKPPLARSELFRCSKLAVRLTLRVVEIQMAYMATLKEVVPSAKLKCVIQPTLQVSARPLLLLQ